MPRKNKEGQYILSAGEIGSYSVCPESWRLRYLIKAEQIPSQSAIDGEELHQSWADEHDSLEHLLKSVRFVLLLALFAIGITILLNI